MEEPFYARGSDRLPTKRDQGAIEALDEQLNILAEVIEILEGRLASVRSQYATAERLSEPRAEPANALRSRIETLGNCIGRLRRLGEEIDL